MPPRGCLPNPCPMGAVDSRVTRSVGVGRAAMARVLPGLQKPPPDKDLAGGRFAPFALCALGLGVVLLLFGFGLTLVLPPLPGSVRRRPRLRLPVHSHRGKKSVPLLLYTDRSPRAWATHKRYALLGQAQERCAGRQGGFYRGKFLRALRLPCFLRVVRRGEACVMRAACVRLASAQMCH